MWYYIRTKLKNCINCKAKRITLTWIDVLPKQYNELVPMECFLLYSLDMIFEQALVDIHSILKSPIRRRKQLMVNTSRLVFQSAFRLNLLWISRVTWLYNCNAIHYELRNPEERGYPSSLWQENIFLFAYNDGFSPHPRAYLFQRSPPYMGPLFHTKRLFNQPSLVSHNLIVQIQAMNKLKSYNNMPLIWTKHNLSFI